VFFYHLAYRLKQQANDWLFKGELDHRNTMATAKDGICLWGESGTKKFPGYLRETKIQAQIEGVNCCALTVTQTYLNGQNETLKNCVYTFNLNDSDTVVSFRKRIFSF
jgi:capsule polysaccharide modification protein KpsS